MINVETSEVVGVHYAQGAPDEKEPAGSLPHALGQEIYWIYGCLNKENDFDLDSPDCILKNLNRFTDAQVLSQ